MIDPFFLSKGWIFYFSTLFFLYAILLDSIILLLPSYLLMEDDFCRVGNSTIRKPSAIAGGFIFSFSFFMKVHIIGADGQHGRDLRDRHLLEHDEQASRFAVAVPIRKTRGIIEALLSTHPHYDILSLAGLMSITPDNPRIGLIHFLF